MVVVVVEYFQVTAQTLQVIGRFRSTELRMKITYELHGIFIRKNQSCWVSLYVISPRLLNMRCCFGDALAACAHRMHHEPKPRFSL